MFRISCNYCRESLSKAPIHIFNEQKRCKRLDSHDFVQQVVSIQEISLFGFEGIVHTHLKSSLRCVAAALANPFPPQLGNL